MDLTEEAQRILLDWSRKEAPREACGIITPDTLRRMKNHSLDPERSFLCVGPGVEVLHNPDGYVHGNLRGYAIWHSHPQSRAVPTFPDMDLMLATLVPMIIVSLWATVPEIAIYVLDDHNPVRVCCARTYRPS